MGWDLKATADTALAGLDSLPSGDAVLATMPSLESLAPYSGVLSLIAVASLVLAVIFATNFGARLRRTISDVFFTNWQLALLGSAALLLSLAGGWTTWDGMRNFTGESVLSAMFTFGIHGVMLIVAWLIGESFATGMNQVRQGTTRSINAPMIALTLIGGAALVTAAVLYVATADLSSSQKLIALATVGGVLLATALVMLFSRSDVIQPYTQGLRIMAKNAMLWVMFLACMATSVFFSFDSRFNVIFPKDQRERAAEIRTKKQVAGVVSDIGETIQTRRISEAEKLFQSEGWLAYETQLAALSRASEGAESEIEAHFTRQMEAHRSAMAEQQERIATATSGQAGLNSKKITLTDELSRIKADRPTLAAEYATKKGELDARAKEVDAKRVEAMAEDKGVEGTLKAGRGPMYRERMGELGRLRDYYKIGEERVRDAQKRLEAVDTRIATIERELAGVDGELAKFRGEAETAEARIKAAESFRTNREGEVVDPARVRGEFERARVDFREQPDAARLSTLHQQCVQLYDAMISTDATKERVRNTDCDPKRATEAAAAMFALNDGMKNFNANCAGGEKIPDTGGVDPLLQFGRRCLQDSGLPSADVTAAAAQLGDIDLNRDDKAHNFVVTLNAFQDGNRLAYLALAIAIGIDSLIFMTGLFGANAVRSPLSDVPTSKARNSQQLDAMIETALLPDMFKKARLVTQAMHPIENVDGYSNEVRLDELDPETAVQVREVLNAGAIIGAVRRGGREGHYLVRSELLEFLNAVIKRELESNGEAARRGMTLDKLEDQITVALLPDVGPTCEFVLRQLDPINDDKDSGFTSEVYLDQIEREQQPPVLAVLNAGAMFKYAQRASDNPDRYYVHKDLYQTLARIRARDHMRLRRNPRVLAGPAAAAPRFGGSITPKQPALADHTGNRSKNEDADATRSRYVTTLVQALGIDPDFYGAIPHEAFGAAATASETFARARQSNHLLDRVLTERDERARVSLDKAFARLGDGIEAGDAWTRQQLLDAYQEVDQNWPVLMLLPHGPYEAVLKGLVEQLEADNGAGSLSAEGVQLYGSARRLFEAMRASERDSEAAWSRLDEVFEAVERGAHRVASSGNKRSIN